MMMVVVVVTLIRYNLLTLIHEAPISNSDGWADIELLRLSTSMMILNYHDVTI